VRTGRSCSCRSSAARRVTGAGALPGRLLEGLAGIVPSPKARYEARESISLALITALQLLPPRQRAAVILCDVLGFYASEAAASWTPPRSR